MKEVLDVLYWRLHTAYLTNDREKAKKYASMLDEEQRTSDCSLVDAIGETHFNRYIKIRDNMARNAYVRLSIPGYSSPPIEMARKTEKSQHEKLFCKELLGRKQEILNLINFSQKANFVPEVIMTPYGRCDFISIDRENRQAAAIEVKMGDAPSTVISQIDKYMLCLELDMIKQSHNSVYGYVIAESFSPYVKTELARMGVTMIVNSKGNLSVLGIIPSGD